MLALSVRLALISLAVVGSAVADDLDVPVAALEADSECPASDVPCALNALQRRAQSGSAGGGGAEPAAAAEASLEEEVAFDDDEVIADAGKNTEADMEADEAQEFSAVEADEEQNEEFFSRRRATPAPAPTSGAKCCLCRDGTISWSLRGICSHCSSSAIQRKVTPKLPCQSSGNSQFPGSQTCANRCLSYFPGGGRAPAPQPRPCSTMTSGTCRFMGCASSRGGKDAVQCVSKKCVCKPGYCSDGKKCTLQR